MTGQRQMQGQKQGKRQKINDRAKANVEAWAKVMAKATAEVSNACIDNLGSVRSNNIMTIGTHCVSTGYPLFKQILIVENWLVYANLRIDALM